MGHRTPVVCLLLAFAFSARATTLPESYPLMEANGKERPIDPALQAWLDKYALSSAPFSLPADRLEKLAQSQDEVTAAYLRLHYANTNGAPASRALEGALAALKKAKPEAPLLPYLQYEVLETPGVPSQGAASAALGLREGGSCPAKEFLLRQVSEERKADEPDAWVELLARILSVKSPTFKDRSVVTLAETLPPSRRAEMWPHLWPYLQLHPKLIKRIAWIQDFLKTSTGAKARALLGSDTDLDGVQDASRKMSCRLARERLFQILARAPKAHPLEDSLAAAHGVDSCFRASGFQARVGFWLDAQPPFAKAYGSRGLLATKIQEGALYWGVDQFDKARSILTEVMAQAKTNKDADSAAKALFTLGRIEENQGNMLAAAADYKAYTDAYSDHEDFEAAMMSRVLLDIEARKHHEVLAFLHRVIDQQTALAMDARSLGSLSFALFWAGRLHMALGEKDQAIALWRRLASEYYSTFYGAIGHYMLEKASGKRYALQPSRVATFDEAALERSFDADAKATIARVERLLSLGMKHEAVCELNELAAPDGDSPKLLTKALLLHAAGEWLAAVRIYDALPRSFRNTLAFGFERILFPRAYTDTIFKYSERVGVDPHFVMALIRQESVFNPHAQSGVGATGLMQLMPQTATLELSKLPRNYVSAAEHRDVARVRRHHDVLFDAEANLALGVHHLYRLLDHYKSPVLALTSYNANPAATERWVKTIPMDDVLMFIERIPYKETRAYVKLVLRNYFYYSRWYEDASTKLPTLDALLQQEVASNLGYDPLGEGHKEAESAASR